MDQARHIAASDHNRTTMHYMPCFRQPDADFALENDPDASKAYRGAWMACVGALQASGKVLSGNGLLPPKTAAIVRIRDGRREMQDGPYPTRASISAATSSSMSTTSMRPSNGRRAHHARARAASKSTRA